MEIDKKQLALGLAAACIPLPVILHFTRVVIPGSNALPFYLFMIGVPAALLIFGYKHIIGKRDLSLSYFACGAAVVGIAVGLIAVLPIALPMIYFRGAGQSAIEPFGQLVGILCFTTLVSIIYAFIFWLVTLKNIGPREIAAKQL